MSLTRDQLRGMGGLALGLALASALPSACVNDVDAGGKPQASVDHDDPLDAPDDALPGSLDALHRTVVLKSCAAQPGLCHSGQFEPNLSTPALMYANLVRRPGLEHPKQLRADPGHPEKSLVIDKLRDHAVVSRMPLGADPLEEADIAAIEKWIADGALRAPGADPVPILNNPPNEPQIGVFDAAGTRLDALGPAVVAAGTTIEFRQAVQDFETDDSAMPLAVFLAILPDGRQVVLNPVVTDGKNLGTATYDAVKQPEAKGDVFDWKFSWTLADTVDAIDDAGMIETIPSAGLSFAVLAAYTDDALDKGGMLTFTITPDLVKVAP